MTELIPRQRVIVFCVEEDSEFAILNCCTTVCYVPLALDILLLSFGWEVGFFGARRHTADTELPASKGRFCFRIQSDHYISRAAHTLSASRRASRSPFGYVLVEVRPACRRVLALCDAFHLG